MSAKLKNIALSAAFGALVSACGGENANDVQGGGEPLSSDLLAPDGWAGAAAAFVDRNNQQIGFVAFRDAPFGGVVMRLDIAGLSEGWHGAHLHQTGDCSDFAEGFKASGGHINPDGREHGLLNLDGPERADLPNIFAHEHGRATAEIFNGWVSLRASEAAAAADAHALLDDDGFAVVIHANADDHETQPIGGAGERLACAAIRSGL